MPELETGTDLTIRIPSYLDASLDQEGDQEAAVLRLHDALDAGPEQGPGLQGVGRPVVGLGQLGVAHREVDHARGVEAERDLVISLRVAKQVPETQRGAVTEAVTELGVPGVDQELDLHVVQEVKLEPLVPVKVQPSGPHNGSRLEFIDKLFTPSGFMVRFIFITL